MEFSSRLVLLRKQRKIAQNELAKMLGVHTNVLGRYERGETTPSIEIASKIADALGISLDYLAGKTDIELSTELLNKITTIQKLPEEDKKCIMYSLDGMLLHAKTREAYQR